jgi:hypothetical protein
MKNVRISVNASYQRVSLVSRPSIPSDSTHEILIRATSIFTLAARERTLEMRRTALPQPYVFRVGAAIFGRLPIELPFDLGEKILSEQALCEHRTRFRIMIDFTSSGSSSTILSPTIVL